MHRNSKYKYPHNALDILCTACFIISCKSHWIAVNDTQLHLPRSDHLMACAVFNDSIFIFGGRWFHYQLTEYIPSDNHMIDHGETILHEATLGFAQYYTQSREILYINSWFQYPSYHLSVYDLSSGNVVSTVSSIPFPDAIHRGSGCITTSQAFLLITGGWIGNSMSDTLHVFEFQMNKWHNGTSMQQYRQDHGCVVAFDFLYVIGGNSHSSIEKINIGKISTGSWQYIDEDLQSVVAWPGCVVRENIIWIIGGADRTGDARGWETLDTVYIIDAINDSVTLMNERLAYAVNRAAVTILGNTLFVFGGATIDSISFDSWMTYDIRNESNKSTTTTITYSKNKSKVGIVFGSIGMIIACVLIGLCIWYKRHRIMNVFVVVESDDECAPNAMLSDEEEGKSDEEARKCVTDEEGDAATRQYEDEQNDSIKKHVTPFL
eukprot:148940_1